MYSKDNDKIIYLKGLQKGLTILNNNDPNIQQELNKINTIIYNLEQEQEQVQEQNTFKSSLEINYKEEKINKYKNYLQFLEFRKSKIEKSIQEQVYNHTINIDKLNKNLSKTVINIEKYSKLLNEINETDLKTEEKLKDETGLKTEEKLINKNNLKNENHVELNVGIKDFISTEEEELNKHVLIPVEPPTENNITKTEKNELIDVLNNIMNNLNS